VEIRDHKKQPAIVIRRTADKIGDIPAIDFCRRPKSQDEYPEQGEKKEFFVFESRKIFFEIRFYEKN
jgi:hypothetical protein